MAISYTIQRGDTLAKIVREQYGLSGAEVYQKVNEIAQQNNIKNPNLIYTGNSLTLFDLGNENVDQNQNSENANTYQELIEKQKALYQYQDAQIYGLEDNSNYNPDSDRFVNFANPDIFESTDENEKAELYKEAVLEIAEQDIEANDQGEKNGKLDFAEFQEAQLAFFKATYETVQKQLAEDAFVFQYSIQNGKDPSQSEINKAVDEAWQDKIVEYSGDLAYIFANQDINSDGYLDKTEIATGYIVMDIGNITNNSKSLRLIHDNEENSIELDGVIDIEQNLIANKSYLTGLHGMFFGNKG